TLAGNTVTAGGTTASAAAGALYTMSLNNVLVVTANAQAILNNTIFANSIGDGDFVNNQASGTSTVTGSNNLATQTTGLPTTGFTSTTTAALHLGSLASNGGPTQTMALLSGSSALAPAGATATTATFDQRGVARPINAPSDVGAYEATIPTQVS